MELMQLPRGSNTFGRCTSPSTESQRTLLWRDGSSRRSSIACSLAACSQDPRRNRSAWIARALLTLPSSPLILFLYPYTPPSPLRALTRAVTWVDFARLQLCDVALENYKYYIPTASNHPLSNSFTINVEGSDAVVALFHMTTSQIYKGSS